MTDIIKIGYEVDSSQVKESTKHFDDVTKAATSLDDVINKKLKSTLKLVGGLFATWGISSLIKESAELNARFETLGIVMNVVGRNAGYTSVQMNKFAEDTKKMGITMIESRNTVIRMAQAQLDLNKATELARIAQDAAVIGGTNSSEALGRLIIGVQRGEAEILRTIGINVRWEDSYVKMAKQLGKTRAELSEADKTTARMNAVIAEGAKIAGAYEAAMGTAGKQISSMTRYVEDAKVKFGNLFNETLTIAVFGLSDALKSANGELDEMIMEKELDAWSDNLLDAFALVGDTAMSVGTIFRLTGSHIAEFFALRTTDLDTFFGGGQAADIRAAAEADRAAAIAAASTFRDSLSNRRKAKAETPGLDPIIDQGLADAGANEAFLAREAEEAARKAAASQKEAAKEAKKLAGEYASLSEEIMRLNDQELSAVDKLQKKLDAYTKMGPAMRKYNQDLIDQAKAAEMERSDAEAFAKGDENAAELFNAELEAEQAYQKLRIDSYVSSLNEIDALNEDLNVRLIKSDTERARAQIDLENERAIERIQNLGLEGDQVQELLDKQAQAYEKQVNLATRKTTDYAKELGLTFTSAFEDAVVGGKKFKDVLASIAQDIEKMILRKTVTAPLADFIGSFDFSQFFNANGNAFGPSGLIPFAKGGIVDRATPFKFANGGSFSNGVMGEAGPEAILPLSRGANGKLGVESSGSGGSRVVVNVINNADGTVATTNETKDANGNMSIDVIVEKVEGVMSRNIAKGSGISPTLEKQYGLNRAAGVY